MPIWTGIVIPAIDAKGKTVRCMDVKLFNKTHPLHNNRSEQFTCPVRFGLYRKK
jgi:hypothetical protein